MVKFSLERLILRGAHVRLLLIALLIGFISLSAGLVVRIAGVGFSNLAESVWWAFLRLTDPGYLGDDEGALVRTISTTVTVLGYVLFMGALIAIMTQWLYSTISRLELGLTPIVRRNHILLLGWTNRTASIVQELVLSEGRVRRFLRRHGERKLHIVLLCETVTTELRHELKEQLDRQWDEGQIIFRSGIPLRVEHLERVDFANAAAIILPGSDFMSGGSHAGDMRTIKTLLSVSNHGKQVGSGELPLLVAEIFDTRKISVARNAYEGRVEILASDAVISLLIAQNVRHRGLSSVYSELLTHGEGNEVYVREIPEFAGWPLQDTTRVLARAIPLGVLRSADGVTRPLFNPPAGFTIERGDRLVFLARRYSDADPPEGCQPVPMDRGTRPDRAMEKRHRKVLLLGWSDKVPALIREFNSYDSETFGIDILSVVPSEQRTTQLEKYELQTHRVKTHQLSGDYCIPSDLERMEPHAYDNVVVLGCDWLESKEEADARTINGLLLLREILRRNQSETEVLVELLDPENQRLFEGSNEEVLISPLILSHILAHVALRPDLNFVFQELFSSGGAEIYFRPVEYFGLSGKDLTFAGIQEQIALQGEIALGVKTALRGVVELNPDRDQSYAMGDGDEVVVVTTYV
jgi:hypothetical protein